MHAALLPHVGKLCLNVSILLHSGCASECRRGAASRCTRANFGKAEPYRTCGGRAASRTETCIVFQSKHFLFMVTTFGGWLSHVCRQSNHLLFRFSPLARFSLPGDLASAAVATYALDVSDQCYLWNSLWFYRYCGARYNTVSTLLGSLLCFVPPNVVGGFVITDRMLKMLSASQRKGKK